MKFPRPVVLILALSVPVIFCSLVVQAQSPKQDSALPQWQIDAGIKMSYDVASVHADKTKSTRMTSNIPIGPGDYYSPTKGLFSAKNVPLADYIRFAYKLLDGQIRILQGQAPKWVLSDRFDIQARVDGNPTKDQMRLIIQTLLEDRFKLVMHRETRQLPVYALVLDKAGELGPGLHPHTDDAPCPTDPGPTPAPGTVVACGGIQQFPGAAPGRLVLRARKVTTEFMANSLPGENVDRPVIDKTGLAGTFDLHMEFAQQIDGDAVNQSGWRQPGPTFTEALKDQLGLKLEPQTGPVEVFVLDHIDEPSAN